LSPPPPTRRTLALFVLGVAAFTVYGSLVPFEFRARTTGEAIDSFLWAMTRRPLPESRSDALANVLLGVPLGFGMLGLFRLDRPGRLRAAATGLLLLPACAGFAAVVEFAQLYVPVRTCAGSDVVCQTIGAAFGILGWVLLGPRLVEQAREVTGSGAVIRLLVAYLLLLAFVQTLPMDLTLSPRAVGKKLLSVLKVLPFEEFRGANPGRVWERTAQLLQVTALYLPVGLLLANLQGWQRRHADGPGKVFLIGLGLAFVMEGVQLLVASRTSSPTDVAVGATAVTLAWAAGWWFPRGSPLAALPRDGATSPAATPQAANPGAGPRLGAAVFLALIWFAAVAVICWQPFAVAGSATPFDWVPGLPREGKNDLYALEEMLTKLAVFAPFGMLAAAVVRRRQVVLGGAVGLAVAAVLEAGQTVFPPHVPGLTDVILGGCGGMVGAWAAGRVQSAGEGSFRPGVY
jgi:VanZ family protein